MTQITVVLSTLNTQPIPPRRIRRISQKTHGCARVGLRTYSIDNGELIMDNYKAASLYVNVNDDDNQYSHADLTKRARRLRAYMPLVAYKY